MRLLGFGKGIALCVLIAVQQFCVGEELLFDVNGSFSSTTIVSPTTERFDCRPSKSRVAASFCEQDGSGGCTFTREIVALRTLPQSVFVQQAVTLTILLRRGHLCKSRYASDSEMALRPAVTN
jgi:hypothetical protein